MAKGGGRKYNRDKNGRFASTGGARLGGKSKGPKLGSNRPGTSAPKGTIAKSAVNRTLGATRGYGKGSTATPPAPKPKAKKGPKTASGRAGANLRSAQKQLNKNPMSKKAQNSLVTAQAAKDYYKTMGGGRKGAAKPAKSTKSAKPAKSTKSAKPAASSKRKGGSQPAAKTPRQKVRLKQGNSAEASNRSAIATSAPKGTIGKNRGTRVKQRAQRMVAAGDSYASVVPRASQSIKNSARSVRGAKTKATKKARVDRTKANMKKADAGGLDRKAMRSARTARRAMDYYKGKK